MSQEIEIEFKTMLTSDEFEQLLYRLPFPKEPIVQTNYYFETEQFDLKNNRSALRIRKKVSGYTLTLKEPHDEGILETNDPLSQDEARKWLEGQPNVKKNVSERLSRLGIEENQLRLYGSLTTERYTYMENGIYYMLDKSFYHNKVDYELEIEAPSKQIGIHALHELLQEENLEERKALTKIERFFNTLKRQ